MAGDGTDRTTAIALMVAAQKPGQLALDLHAMRFVDLWIVGPVRGIENNAASILAQIFERGLFIVDQSNDDLAVPRASVTCQGSTMKSLRRTGSSHAPRAAIR